MVYRLLGCIAGERGAEIISSTIASFETLFTRTISMSNASHAHDICRHGLLPTYGIWRAHNLDSRTSALQTWPKIPFLPREHGPKQEQAAVGDKMTTSRKTQR